MIDFLFKDITDWCLCFKGCKYCVFYLFSPPSNLMRVKFCCKSHWLDAESGRSPNNGCTLHQWEHPFQQSVPHMPLRPLLHALSRQRVSFMLQDSVHCELPGPRINCFDPIWPSDKRRLSSHTDFQEYSDSLWTLWRVEPTEQVTICARAAAGDWRLDNACI